MPHRFFEPKERAERSRGRQLVVFEVGIVIISPVKRHGCSIRGWACVRVCLSCGLLLAHLLPLLVPGSDLPFQVLKHVQHLLWEWDAIVFQPFAEQVS